MKRVSLVCALILLAAIAGCNKSSTTSPTTTPTGPVVTNTITITSGGVSPSSIQIAVGTRVLFVNNDSKTHTMDSNPHPEHTDCPEINQVGFLSPGQSRETGNFVAIRTCGFHDHDDSSNNRWLGTITIK